MEELGSFLSYGAIGLGLALAVLAYWLLRAEQKEPQARPEILRAIYRFIGFGIFLALGGFTLEIWPQVARPTPSPEPHRPIPPACINIEGRWQKEGASDIVMLTQSGCFAFGKRPSDGASISHEINVAISGDKGMGFTRRTYNGCTTILSGEYEILSHNRLRVVAEGHGCDLMQLKQTEIYVRVE